MVSTMFKSDELMFLKGYLKGMGLNNALKALNLAEKLHAGVNRKSGEPYISHPCRIANALISLGINDEEIICAVLLHDVLEDTDIKEYELGLIFGDEILNLIKLVTKCKGISNTKYYEEIKKNYKASIVKIADRCHNVATMNYFTVEKIELYIAETEGSIIPLCSRVSDEHPEYSNQVYYMKYHIESILEMAKFFLKDNEDKKAEEEKVLKF